jgi:hypothetical protein
MSRPTDGPRRLPKIVMSTASKIYEALEFTEESNNGPRTYLEWKAKAFDGQTFSGMTVITKDARDQIVRIAIHHRPLGAVLRFSTE